MAKEQERDETLSNVFKNIENSAKSTNSEIDNNIAVSSFVERENTNEEVDILELNAEIEEIVIKQSKLCTAIDEIVADLEGIER